MFQSFTHVHTNKIAHLKKLLHIDITVFFMKQEGYSPTGYILKVKVTSKEFPNVQDTKKDKKKIKAITEGLLTIET